ncbi:hypothetical protein tinsulaeT_32780 [Thalassotalea insulae]|uniref:Uncharacterized protein n=1 Tax=Thalassotalea insulae TaxID=2056778 RepID=A0ABQ6GVI2_9GAMM|nr:hypothetical protein tinsulaeT_32780 [Thalassotalea insulae]
MCYRYNSNASDNYYHLDLQGISSTKYYFYDYLIK